MKFEGRTRKGKRGFLRVGKMYKAEIVKVIEENRSVVIGSMNVEEEVERLKEEIKRLGIAQADGSYKVGTYLPSSCCSGKKGSVIHFLSANIDPACKHTQP